MTELAIYVGGYKGNAKMLMAQLMGESPAQSAPALQRARAAQERRPPGPLTEKERRERDEIVRRINEKARERFKDRPLRLKLKNRGG